MAGFDLNNAIFGMALLAITTVLAITRLFRGAGWVAAAVSLVAMGVLLYTKLGLSLTFAILLVGYLVAFFVAAWLAGAMVRQIEFVDQQLVNAQRLIEQLRINDPDTGLVRFQYARQTLINEVSRSQRYNTDLCILVADVADWESIRNEFGISYTEILKKDISRIFQDNLRGIDTSFSDNKWGAILPMTKKDGAQIVARRLIDRVARQTRVAMCVGIAQFPADGVSDAELLKACEAALRVAVTSGQPIAEYSLIRGAAETSSQDASDGKVAEQTAPAK